MTTNNANAWNPKTILAVSEDSKAIEQTFTAGNNQTLFKITDFEYAVGTGSLAVYKNGLRLDETQWTEQTSTSFAVPSAVAGDKIIAAAFAGITGTVVTGDIDIYADNYQSLRDYTDTQTCLYARGQVTFGDGGAFFYQLKTGAAPGFYVDNNSTIIVPTGGDGSSAWVRDEDPSSIANFVNVTTMLAAVNTGDPAIGDIYNAGGTTFEAETISTPMTINDFKALNEVTITAFGALPSLSDAGAATQLAIDYAAPRGYAVRVQGNYNWSSTVNIRPHTTLLCDSSQNSVARDMGNLFLAQTSGADIDKIKIQGGNWTEADGGEGITPTVTFFRAIGEYNAGSPKYVSKVSINEVRLSRFNYGVHAEYMKTFNIAKSFFYTRNGIELNSKCVEGNINNNMIYGREYRAADTRGIVIGEGVTQTSMYCEGIKIFSNGIDGHGRCVSFFPVLDLNIFDNWISCGTGTPLTHYCLYVDRDAVNNLFKSIHIHDNTFSRGLISFADQAAPPVVADMMLSGNSYINAQQVRIGTNWWQVNMNNWEIERNSGETGTGIGILLAGDNSRCTIKNIHFRRPWTKLVSMSGGTGTNNLHNIIENVWADEYIESPFNLEGPVRVNNSYAAEAPVLGSYQGGQIIYAKELSSAVEGGFCLSMASQRFKKGSVVEMKVQGLVTCSSASGRLTIESSTAGSVETIVQEPTVSTWTTRRIDLLNGTQRLEHTHFFKVTSDDATIIRIRCTTGDLTVSANTMAYLKYI